MSIDGKYQIGEVAERTGLSLRTIRHYEEVHLVPPSGRTTGGFRLYTDDDVERLILVKRLKPLGFSLDDMGAVLEALDGLRSASNESKAAPHRKVLAGLVDQAASSCAELRTRLESAEGLVEELRQELPTNAANVR